MEPQWALSPKALLHRLENSSRTSWTLELELEAEPLCRRHFTWLSFSGINTPVPQRTLLSESQETRVLSHDHLSATRLAPLLLPDSESRLHLIPFFGSIAKIWWFWRESRRRRWNQKLCVVYFFLAGKELLGFIFHLSVRKRGSSNKWIKGIHIQYKIYQWSYKVTDCSRVCHLSRVAFWGLWYHPVRIDAPDSVPMPPLTS